MSGSSKYRFSENLFTIKKREAAPKQTLDAIDEVPDFHDPYSELSLFLSQKIKEEMRHTDSCKKWSLKLQEELIQKITPEFKKKFPRYRLGISALKKTWEKIHYYSHQIQNQKEALTQDGKLNIHFLIKENLKTISKVNHICQLHPYHYAHQMALKMSEYIATVDGKPPQLEFLTQMIWSAQRHLLPPQQSKSPYDAYDKIDQLIVKMILEINAKVPEISQAELSSQIKESLYSFAESPLFASHDQLYVCICTLLAEKLYAFRLFHTSLHAQQKQAILQFVRKQVLNLQKESTKIEQVEIVKQVKNLCLLSADLQNVPEEDFINAIDLFLSKDQLHISKSLLQLISTQIAFFSCETHLLKNENMRRILVETFKEIKNLPILKENEKELLDIMIWKQLSETGSILETLPYRMGQKIEEELGFIFIENPHLSFAQAAQTAVDFFQKAKELAKSKNWPEVEHKIHLWSMQGDMLLRWVRLNQDSKLFSFIYEKCKESKNLDHLELDVLVIELSQKYLQIHPHLTSYSSQLVSKIWISLKYCWYQLFASRKETTFDLFMKWHHHCLQLHDSTGNEKRILKQLEEICKKSVPLIPFDSTRAEELLFSKEKKQTKNHAGNT